MAWCFRLRAGLNKPIRTDDLPATISVCGLPAIEVSRQPTSASKGADGQGQSKTEDYGKFHVFICRGFEDEAAAWNAGKSLSDALIIWGAVEHVGVDVGFSRMTLQFSDAVKDKIRESSGKELYGEMLGLMVYLEDSVVVMGVNAELRVETLSAVVEKRLSEWLPYTEHITEAQRVCADLINDSHRVPHLESKFVLVVAAVEVLSEKAKAIGKKAEAVDMLMETLEQSVDDIEIRRGLKGVLMSARWESSTAACQRKLLELVGSNEAKRFGEVFGKRSAFVHAGKGRGELQQETTDLTDIAIRLLKADLISSYSPCAS